jgi:hypothetical protein
MPLSQFLPNTAAGRALLNDSTVLSQRISLNIDQLTIVSDGNASITNATEAICLSAITAPRTFTLNASSTFNSGQTIYIFDKSGLVSATLTLTIAVTGSDTINGASSYIINTAYGFAILIQDGAGKWIIVSSSKVPASNVTGLATSATTDTTNATNITSGTLPVAQVPTLSTSKISGLATSATTDTTNASNIGSGTLAQARLPSSFSIGFTVSPYSISTGSFTVTPANGNYQYVTNNGAYTITAPSSDCAVDILVTNGGSAGSTTFSGFTVGSSTGTTLTTTNTNKFIISVRRINGVSTYSIYGLQ